MHPTLERWPSYSVWFQLLPRIGWVLPHWFTLDCFSIKPGVAVTGGAKDYDDGIPCHVSFLLIRKSWMMGPSSPRRWHMVLFIGVASSAFIYIYEGDLAPTLTPVIGLWETAYDDLQ